MPKELFTQSAVVLVEKPPTLEAVQEALSGCTYRGTVAFEERDAEGKPLEGGINWAGTEVLAFDLRAESGAVLLVDVVPHPWPDAGADVEEDPRLFAAMAAGQLGPFVFPESLERARVIGGADERGLEELVARHGGFVRLRTSWALTQEQPTEMLPEDYDPVVELRFITEIASLLLELPEALCYFNPNSEVLATPEELETSLDRADEEKVLPMELWANLRFVELSDLEGWAMADTVGMMQLDLPDHDALFRREAYDPREIAVFLRQANLHTMQSGRPFDEGEIAVGPGKQRWRAYIDCPSIMPIPRAVVRWVPMDGFEDQIPRELLETVEETEDEEGAAG